MFFRNKKNINTVYTDQYRDDIFQNTFLENKERFFKCPNYDAAYSVAFSAGVAACLRAGYVLKDIPPLNIKFDYLLPDEDGIKVVLLK